ncbi:MAG: hypothetical protein ACHQNE_00745 [Candidatus Kapaibacterium sp.]
MADEQSELDLDYTMLLIMLDNSSMGDKEKEHLRKQPKEIIQLALDVHDVLKKGKEELRQKKLDESTIKFNEAQMAFIEKQTAFLDKQSDFMTNQEERDKERDRTTSAFMLAQEARDVKRDRRDNTIKWAIIFTAVATVVIAIKALYPPASSNVDKPTSIQQSSRQSSQQVQQQTKPKEPSATTDTVARKPLPPNHVP